MHELHNRQPKQLSKNSKDIVLCSQTACCVWTIKGVHTRVHHFRPHSHPPKARVSVGALCTVSSPSWVCDGAPAASNYGSI